MHVLNVLMEFKSGNTFFALGFPGGPEVKNPPADAGNLGSVPELGISSGRGNGNPLQYSCVGNPMDRGAWHATVHGVIRVLHELATQQQQFLHCL